ncbi:MAG: glutaminyl-peptide cyclotransferase [Acidobacteriota bacterium]
MSSPRRSRPSRLGTLLVAVLAGLPAACSSPQPAKDGGTPASVTPASTVEKLRVEVIARFPHDESAFTQGLLWHEGELYESTGQRGRSRLRRVEPRSGQVVLDRPLKPELFGEGLALVDRRLVQLTYTSGLALVYRLHDLTELARYRYDGEGWGLTHDGTRLIMSDGSPRLTFRDDTTFEVIGGVDVTLNGKPLREINELEWADGQVWANVWTTDHLVRIDPETGVVTAVIDASGLLTSRERAKADVLNGIAHDPANGLFFLTGKHWPWLFAVQFVPDE